MAKQPDNPKPPRTLRERAEEMARTSPTDIAGMSIGDVQRLVHELQIHQIELELQNEELRETQVELAHTRDRYSDLYEFAPVGYLSLDADGVIRDVNLTAADLLARKRRSLIDRKLAEFVARESQDTWFLHWREALESKVRTTCELRMTRPQGPEFDAQADIVVHGMSYAEDAGNGTEVANGTDRNGTEAVPYSAAGNAVPGVPHNEIEIRVTLSDITERKLAGAQLEASEQRYRRLTDAVIDYIFTVRVANGNAVETIHGPNCEAVTGYTPEDFAANSLLWISIVPEEDRPLVEQHVREILLGERPAPLEHRIHRKDGKVRWVLRVTSPHVSEHGRLIAYDGLLRDITDRKEAESALRELNIDLNQSLTDRTAELHKSVEQIKLFSEAIAHLGEGVVITSDHLDWPGPHILFVNEAMCQITGYTADELIGQSPRVLQGDGTNRDTLDRVKRDLSAGRSTLAELINYRKDGTPYDAELYITPLFNAEGHRTNFVSIHRDITERKQAEQALRRSEKEFRTLAESVPAYFAYVDNELCYRFVNKGYMELFERPVDQIIGRRVSDILGDPGWELVRPRVELALSGEEVHWELQMPVPGAEHRWFSARYVPNYEGGHVVGIFVLTLDITDRKNAEQALRDSQDRLRAIVNTATDGIITIDRDGIITAVNPAASRMFAYSTDEMQGQNISMLMPSPFREQHDGYLSHYQETGQARIIGTGREVIGKRHDGSTFPIDLAVSEVEHLGLYTGIVRDISERRRLEREVLEIAEAERQEIGQDLHDDLGQQLAGLGMMADGLAKLTERQEQPSEARDAARQIQVGLKRAGALVRSMAYGLTPIDVKSQSLADALTALAQRFHDSKGLHCSFEGTPDVVARDNQSATHVFRIAQEAVTNAVRHGSPQHIWITLEKVNRLGILLIRDDGSGFEIRGDVPLGGVGMRSMEFRAQQSGATLNVESEVSGGTTVTCTFPLK